MRSGMLNIEMMQTPYDKKIRNIIKNGSNRDYDAIIRNENDREIFYQLSSLRNGVLCWYPFDPEWRCLEIGAGFGSITGTLIRSMPKTDVVEPDKGKAESLLERYQDSQIAVYSKLPQDREYDCVVITGSFTKATDAQGLLKLAFELLSEDGVLLLAYDNRLGMNDETLFSKAEVDALALGAGFEEQYYYYILPDMLFPQAVYSEKELPDENMDRFFFNSAFSSVRAEDKKAAFMSAVKNGTFEERAEHYLVEFRKKPNEGPRVIKAFLSCDRGRDHSFIIRFLDNGTVEKLPVYPEGRETLCKMYFNLQTLESRGICTLCQEMTGSYIKMPFVDKPSLLWHLKEHPDQTEEIFEMLYQNILGSSEMSSDGMFLQCGYIDMVPFNCFYDDGKLIYYDQEFTETHCPVSYIMFRAVYYTYLHIPELNMWIPQEKLKEKYGLRELWDAYKEKEESFVRDNRNLDLYYRFWSQT